VIDRYRFEGCHRTYRPSLARISSLQTYFHSEYNHIDLLYAPYGFLKTAIHTSLLAKASRFKDGLILIVRRIYAAAAMWLVPVPIETSELIWVGALQVAASLTKTHQPLVREGI
jgi:hypothetical protein